MLYMVKLDFVIICLGLFLIIIVALMIGSNDTLEGFANKEEYYKTNFNTYYDKLKSEFKNINDVKQNFESSVAVYINTSKKNVDSIISEKETDFIGALINFNKFVNDNLQISKEKKGNINKNIFNLLNLVKDKFDTNVKLPTIIKRQLSLLWWECTKIYNSITNETDNATKFKKSYELATNYVLTDSFNAKQVGEADDIERFSMAVYENLKTLKIDLENFYNEKNVKKETKEYINSKITKLLYYGETLKYNFTYNYDQIYKLSKKLYDSYYEELGIFTEFFQTEIIKDFTSNPKKVAGTIKDFTSNSQKVASKFFNSSGLKNSYSDLKNSKISKPSDLIKIAKPKIKFHEKYPKITGKIFNSSGFKNRLKKSKISKPSDFIEIAIDYNKYLKQLNKDGMNNTYKNAIEKITKYLDKFINDSTLTAIIS